MKESINNLFLTGELVKKGLEIAECDRKDINGNIIGKDKCIRGELVIRTADGSENGIKYYATRLKKDGNENSLYKGLETVMNEYKSIETHPDNADVVRIGSGKIGCRDYVKEEQLRKFNEFKANFVNRIEEKDLESTVLESKFEVEGIIQSMTDEIIKDVPTGNLIIDIISIGYKGTLIPIKTMVVGEELVSAFKSAGFFEGCYAKLVGKLVNTTEKVEVVEEMAFGSPNVKTFDKTTKRLEVYSGNPMGMPTENGITEEDWQQALAKREIHLSQVKEKAKNNSNSANPFGGGSQQQTPPQSAPNPFGGAVNPFAGK